MQKIVLLIATLLCLTAATISCKKDKALTKRDILIGTWEMTAWAWDDNYNNVMDATEVDYLENFLTVTFRSDDSYTSISFNSSGAPIDTVIGTWKLVNSDMSLQTTALGTVETSSIDSLTSNTFIISGPSSSGKTVWQIFSR